MNKRLENIKNLIGKEADVCMVEDGAPCLMCGDCLLEPDETLDVEMEARINYQRDAFDWGR